MNWLARKPDRRLNPQASPNNALALARQIDAHFDAMLYDGIPAHQARRIEQERREAHSKLTQAALSVALDGWRR